MKNPVKILCYSASFLIFSSTVAISCAFQFPWQLLDNRNVTLLSLTGQNLDFDSPIGGDFMARLALILPITAKEKNNFTRSMERYTKEHPNTVSWMHGNNLAKNICQETGSAYQQAASLFHDRQYDAAYKVLDLLSHSGSAKEQVCARYNLARVMEIMPGDHNIDAIKAYISTIELVADQGIDPYDLGLAAYGQAAKLILEQGDPNSKQGMFPLGVVNNKTLEFEVGELQKNSVSQLHRALYFYVKQALLGGETGKASVAIVMRGLTDPDNPKAKELLYQSMKDPFIRKILLAYVLNHDLFYRNSNQKAIQNIFDSFVKATEDKVDMDDDWGALAAFAYQQQDIVKAQFFADQGMKKKPQAISAWILAKLALMHNQKDKAQEYYHQAITLLSDNTIVPEEQHKIQGEQSVLTLSTGDFVQALEQLWLVRDEYWGDIVYLTEDVLTVDELKQFVDTHTKPFIGKLPEGSSYNAEYLLRDLVAKRLQRVGRGQEALSYYIDPKDRQAAVYYLEARQQVRQRKSVIDQAQATWKVAQILRDKGMEIMGTTGYPDYAPGDVFGGVSQSPDTLVNNHQWSVDEEQARLTQSMAQPQKRFHYRYLAANEAIKSANLLPSRSQAYAAILCNANGWMQNTASYEANMIELSDHKEKTPNLADQTADIIYKLYVKNGAIVPFAMHFGHDCPSPNFETVPLTQTRMQIQDIHDYLHQLKHRIIQSNKTK